MAEVLHSPTHNDPISQTLEEGISRVLCGEIAEQEIKEEEEREEEEDRVELSLLALLVTLFRKSFWVTTCKTDRDMDMDIGCPTNVRHVAHVTFDRFNGFLGLPVEFEPDVPTRAPSASATVFGVSTESMQLSYDTRGNSVPSILLLMQQHLYLLGGLQAEGIFRINGENSQEEYVRTQLNRGVVPEDIDVHCLAGLIKAWFRELPSGILDNISPEQVMHSQSEEDCSVLLRLLPPTETALLDWAVNLMADVVQQEHLNKMNARNIAMVFAPNMMQMADPMAALTYAVQVMNFLKTLIAKTLREREDPVQENGETGPQLESVSDSNQEEYVSNSTSAEKSVGGGPGETPSRLSSVIEGPKTWVEYESTESNSGKVNSQKNIVQALGPVEKKAN